MSKQCCTKNGTYQKKFEMLFLKKTVAAHVWTKNIHTISASPLVEIEPTRRCSFKFLGENLGKLSSWPQNLGRRRVMEFSRKLRSKAG